MNLLALRNEVLSHGFDPIVFTARINSYLNDAQALVCRRVQFYTDEAVNDFSTVNGTTTYALPANFARIRSLRYPAQTTELQAVSLRDIDRSNLSSGVPRYYAMDGANVHLYPTPDSVYALELRYWLMPPTLVNDTDVPVLPADWHHLLWVYATWLCYEAEDDSAMGQYWQQRFNTELAEFTSDSRFPSSDYPTQLASMWDSDRGLGSPGWSAWGGYP